jgi:cysteine desulfurase
MPITPKDIIYLDNNATTPVAPEVVEAMLPFLMEFWGNPSSAYRFGSQVQAEIEKARQQIASLIGADPKEIFFTSCGTESDNTAISSALETTGKKKVVTTAVEHSAIIKQTQKLQKAGIEVVYMPVRSDGTLDFKEIEKAVDEDTALCSVMWANNETGVIFPVEEIAEFCKLKGVLFHTDAVPAVGKIPINVSKNKIDMLSMVGHKLHAPKGVGAIYVRRKTRFVPSMIGGSQEKGKRGGTENVASIIGFGKACELAATRLEDENTRVRALRDNLETALLTKISGVTLNGNKQQRLPNTSNLSFDLVEAESILLQLDQNNICVSSGSACTTGSVDPSHVLLAMGIPAARARGAIRFSLSPYNTSTEIDRAIEIIPKVIEKLRKLSPSARGIAPGSASLDGSRSALASA